MDGTEAEHDDLGDTQVFHLNDGDPAASRRGGSWDTPTPPPGYRQVGTRFGEPPREPVEWDENPPRLPRRFPPSYGSPPPPALPPPAIPYGQAAYGPPPSGDQPPTRYSDLPPRDLALTESPYSGRHERREGPDEDRASRDPAPLRRSRLRQRALAADEEDAEDEPAVRRVMPLWQELPLLLVVAFCMAVLIRTFLMQAFFIPSTSMEETLLVGDRVLVNKIVYDVRTPQRGEVVVFQGTDSWLPQTPAEPSGGLVARIARAFGDLVGVSRPGEKDFIKRVIGLPGDRVSCCDPQGRIYVNGIGIDEPYVSNNSPADLPPSPQACGPRRFDEVLVPPGQIFVMGDNRLVSQDSRCQGPVPIENVIGRAFAIVWPSGRWNALGVPAAFANVPGPVALGPAAATGTTEVSTGRTIAPSLSLVTTLVVAGRWGAKRRRRPRTLRR